MIMPTLRYLILFRNSYLENIFLIPGNQFTRMEQIRELPGGKFIRKYSPEHPLFDAGTRLWATKYYQAPECESSGLLRGRSRILAHAFCEFCETGQWYSWRKLAIKISKNPPL